MSKVPAFLTGALAPRLPCAVTQSFRAGAVCMGRRSEKIKNRKESQTRARTKVFARIGKMITMAAKSGGPDVTTNKALADALEAGRAVNFPKDTAEKAIARASNSNQAEFKESSFEVYAHGGVGMYVEILTDNVNRASADVRTVVTRNKLKIASPGSVAFNFNRRGVILVDSQSVPDDDELLLTAVETGAEECDRDPDGEEFYRIITEPATLNTTRNILMDAGYTVESAQLAMVPKSLVNVSADDAELNIKAVELLEDLDDVDGVYTNMVS